MIPKICGLVYWALCVNRSPVKNSNLMQFVDLSEGSQMTLPVGRRAQGRRDTRPRAFRTEIGLRTLSSIAQRARGVERRAAPLRECRGSSAWTRCPGPGPLQRRSARRAPRQPAATSAFFRTSFFEPAFSSCLLRASRTPRVFCAPFVATKVNVWDLSGAKKRSRKKIACTSCSSR